MTITTFSTVAHVTPTVLKTFFKHIYTQAKKAPDDRRTEATDELLFDEAFHIVKRFISLATSDTVSALQAFTNTYVPAQPWATVIPTLIPISCCDEAASILIDYFGPKDLAEIVGGEKWWQVRGIAGVQGEWIAQSSDWKKAKQAEKYAKANGEEELVKEARRKMKETKASHRHERKVAHERRNKREQQAEGSDFEDDATEEEGEALDSNFEELNRLKRTMLYVHGGGYYFGSVNTHRYQIVRLARKYGGRAFAVNYRKAPNYPWPCPLQDALAAYLYLIRPPPEAKHAPIDPSQIVVAGDSAGGGLSLALLAVLRDMDLPKPAGAVLISPWCDLTHSFPSILQNTETDIIPTYGFIHKPSTLWPVPGSAPESESRKDEPDMPVPQGIDGEQSERQSLHPIASHHDGDGGEDRGHAGPHFRGATDINILDSGSTAQDEAQAAESRFRSKWYQAPDKLYAKPIKVSMSDGDEIELKQQIQLYATNDQVYHPLCSPVLQGSLGGLPPLYILAGDAEVLRDEIIYLAHRAAKPEQYPLRQDLLDANERAQANARRFNSQPTKVHLQLFDDQCHVLTLFSFTTSATYAYRAIASFVKHVTGAPTNHINPFPKLEQVSSLASEEDESDQDRLGEVPSNPEVHEKEPVLDGLTAANATNGKARPANLQLDTVQQQDDATAGGALNESPTTMSGPNSAVPNGVVEAVRRGSVASQLSSSGSGTGSLETGAATLDKDALKELRRRKVTLGSENRYDGMVPLRRPTFVQHMIRERVDIRGQIRPLEDESQLQALRMPTNEVGVIKEGPVKRYLEGQRKWDKRFARTAKRVEKKRVKNEEKAKTLIRRAERRGLLREDEQLRVTTKEGGRYVRYGPLDCLDERPPPSALAGRRDCEEAVALLRASLHMKAQAVGLSRRQRMYDRIYGEPRSTAAEKQVEGTKAKAGGLGLAAWGGAMSGALSFRKFREGKKGKADAKVKAKGKGKGRKGHSRRGSHASERTVKGYGRAGSSSRPTSRGAASTKTTEAPHQPPAFDAKGRNGGALGERRVNGGSTAP